MTGRELAASGGPGYDIAELVDAISRSATTARWLVMLENPQVKGRDISFLLSGSNAAVLNSSLMEHGGAVESLREAISEDTALASAVTGIGFSIEGRLAAQIDNEKSVTFLVR